MPTKKPLIGAAIVGQSGGPSSVINASAYGVIKPPSRMRTSPRSMVPSTASSAFWKIGS